MNKLALLLIAALIIFALVGCESSDPWPDPVYYDELHVTTTLTLGGVPISTSGTANVTSANVIVDNSIVRGDGGVRGIQGSQATISDFGVIYTPGDINTDSDVNVGNDLNVTNDLDVTDDMEVGGISIFNDDIQLVGDGRVTQGLWLNADAIKAPGAKPATAAVIGPLETGVWRFADQALEANQETVSLDYKVPYGADLTVAPTLIVGWSADVTVGDVVWQLEYAWTEANESTWSAAQETLTVTSTVSTTQYGLTIATFTGIDLPSSDDVCIRARLMRKSADAADTMTDDADLLGLCLEYTLNRIGG